MSSLVSPALVTPLCVLGSAAAYAAAMVMLKVWGLTPGFGGALCAAAFLLGAALEAAALREARLGAVYIAVLGVESVIVLAAGAALFGESYSLREWAGGALVMVGVMLAAI